MIAQLFQNNYMVIAGIALAFILTFVLLVIFKDKLPQDQGRAFAVDGTLSKGKARGCGIVFIFAFVLVDILFNRISTEHIIYLVILVCTMLSGFFDDAADKPWNEYLKGAIDLVLAVGVAVTYLYYNGNTFYMPLFKFNLITIPYWLYGVLIVVLVWVSINVTNCSDGVDGLCATLSIISIGSFYILSKEVFGVNDFVCSEVLFIAVLMAYLWFNSTPSTMLMGDAGSRAIGMFIAMISLKSGCPLLFVPFALVMILDGGLGLVKVALLRFLKIRILKNTRCPLHDQARKVNNWSNTQVCYRFTIIQLLICAIVIWLIRTISLV